MKRLAPGTVKMTFEEAFEPPILDGIDQEDLYRAMQRGLSASAICYLEQHGKKIVVTARMSRRTRD